MDLQFYKEWSDWEGVMMGSWRSSAKYFLLGVVLIHDGVALSTKQASFCRFTLNKMALNCFVAACVIQINKLDLNLTAAYFLTMAVQTFCILDQFYLKKNNKKKQHG